MFNKLVTSSFTWGSPKLIVTPLWAAHRFKASLPSFWYCVVKDSTSTSVSPALKSLTKLSKSLLDLSVLWSVSPLWSVSGFTCSKEIFVCPKPNVPLSAAKFLKPLDNPLPLCTALL